MKNKINFIPQILLMTAVFVFCFPAAAQTVVAPSDQAIPPPAEEQFQKIDALATPWRNSGCNWNSKAQEPDCYQVSEEEFQAAHILVMYDENASLWYRFSLSPESPIYFYKNKQNGFLPFATAAPIALPTIVFLRLTGESPHWYQVEVNEETQATKYVLKSDPMWSKTSWSYWLYSVHSIRVDFEKTPLYNKPNGQIIERLTGGDYIYAGFLKAEGDWANVTGVSNAVDNNKRFTGWVRWREGRRILVQTVFDLAQFPEWKPEDRYFRNNQ